jgi:hypothetical protein
LRETRACLICITHWTFEYIDGLPFPDVREVIDMHVTMKGGGKRRARPGQSQQFDSVAEEQAFNVAMAKENATARREMKHISTQPLWVQRHFASRNKSMDELFPKKGK